jgi:type IV pilus assembly protein PilB
MEKFGRIAVSEGYISEAQLAEALEHQAVNPKLLGKLLTEAGWLTDEQLARVLSIQLSLPYYRPAEMTLAPELLALILPRQAERLRLIPVELTDDKLMVATSEPLNLEALDQLRKGSAYKIKIGVAAESQITAALQKCYGAALESVATVLEDLTDTDLSQYQSQAFNEISQISPENMANEAPIIRLVNTMISGAVTVGASDIHLEPFEDEIKLRYRVDGVLQETDSPPRNLYNAVVSRIKLMAGMDITERRIPQDGRIRLQTNNRDLDLRVAVAPTLHGEAVVMRLLNRESIMLGLEQLGFSATNLNVFARLISKPHGMILVTGPTGSGKTTTLYAALQRLNDPSRKIITIEDPIEYQLKGVNQMQANPKLNFGFAQGLRTIVRLDPDVILVGEIRDRETAEVAIQSALTGHLVFATLHTNDAASAFTRLVDMGIEEFLVASTVHGVLAQRLVRRICPSCRESYPATPAEAELLHHDPPFTLQQGSGCEKCNGIGYKGQQGIFELLVINEEIERLIMERASSNQIREAAIRQGMITLRADGLEKVRDGVTTLAEIVRVTGESGSRGTVL